MWDSAGFNLSAAGVEWSLAGRISPPWTVELTMRRPTRASSSAIHPPLAYRVESHRAGTHTTHRQASSLLTHHSPRIRGTYSSTAVTVGQYLTSGLLHHTRQSVSARGPHLLTSLASTTHSCRSTCKAKQSSLPFALPAYLSTGTVTCGPPTLCFPSKETDRVLAGRKQAKQLPHIMTDALLQPMCCIFTFPAERICRSNNVDDSGRSKRAAP